jgi:UDPglucose 6-dehydrogenase
MKICVVGTGYVGLVTGTGFAEIGNHVICVDVDQQKVETLQRGQLPIYEPGLNEMVKRNVEGKRLSFSSDVGQAIASCSVVFVAVGTPSRRDGGANLGSVDVVAQTVRDNAVQETVLVLKSTVPVGTNARIQRIVQDSTAKIHVVSNPEFLKEGEALGDFLRPDRIVVGVANNDEFAKSTMHRLYHPVCLNRDHIVWMNPESAELTKYVANTMLAMRISFMNEIAGLCEKVGADVHSVRHGISGDPRIGGKFLYAGPGYGGSCFPKDVAALVHTAREHDIELELAGATDRINQRQKGVLVRKLRKHLGDLRNHTIAVWGLAFKPKTDDIRESPAMAFIDAVLADGGKVIAHDPIAGENARQYYGNLITVVEDPYTAAEGAEALVLLTEWRLYQSPDFERLKEIMGGNLILDGRNIWSTYQLGSKLGFNYEGVGVIGN